MIKLLGALPSEKSTLALSGGVDSVVLFDFMLKGKRDFQAAYFNHGTAECNEAQEFVEQLTKKHSVPLVIGTLQRDRKKEESLEEYWRRCRYRFLNSFDHPVLTAHHLDDAVETWIMNTLHGKAETIPYNFKNVLRPFLISTRKEILQQAKSRNLEWIEAPSNANEVHLRNFVRHTMMPNVLHVNPGIHKTVKKIILSNFNGA